MNHFLKYIFILLCLVSAKSFATSHYSINQLPFSLDGEWTVCVQSQSSSKQTCNPIEVSKPIESVFEDFDGFMFYRTQFFY